MNIERVVFWLILFTLTITLGNSFLLIEHEEAHKQIFEQFQIESRIVYGFASGKTIPLSGFEKISEENLTVLNYLHSENEIVGYHSFALFNGFVVAFFFGILFLKSEPNCQNVAGQFNGEVRNGVGV